MGPVHHEADVLGRGVQALAVQDGTLKHVGELSLVPQEGRAYKVHHAPGEKKKM